ncbi:hypothetical protein ACFL0T_01065 [Candidatus Omnitrophota bacterium]
MTLEELVNNQEICGDSLRGKIKGMKFSTLFHAMDLNEKKEFAKEHYVEYSEGSLVLAASAATLLSQKRSIDPSVQQSTESGDDSAAAAPDTDAEESTTDTGKESEVSEDEKAELEKLCIEFGATEQDASEIIADYEAEFNAKPKSGVQTRVTLSATIIIGDLIMRIADKQGVNFAQVLASIENKGYDTQLVWKWMREDKNLFELANRMGITPERAFLMAMRHEDAHTVRPKEGEEGLLRFGLITIKEFADMLNIKVWVIKSIEGGNLADDTMLKDIQNREAVIREVLTGTINTHAFNSALEAYKMNLLTPAERNGISKYLGVTFIKVSRVTRKNSSLMIDGVDMARSEIAALEQERTKLNEELKKIDIKQNKREHSRKSRALRNIDAKIVKLTKDSDDLDSKLKERDRLKEELSKLDPSAEADKEAIADLLKAIDSINKKIDDMMELEAGRESVRRLKEELLKTATAIAKGEIPTQLYVFEASGKTIDLRSVYSIDYLESGLIVIRERSGGMMTEYMIDKDGNIMEGSIQAETIGADFVFDSAKRTPVKGKDKNGKDTSTITREVTIRDSATGDLACKIVIEQQRDWEQKLQYTDIKVLNTTGKPIVGARASRDIATGKCELSEEDRKTIESHIESSRESHLIRSSIAMIFSIVQVLPEFEDEKKGLYPTVMDGIDQIEAIIKVAFAPSVFSVMPTGFGKTQVVFRAVALINSKLRKIMPEQFATRKTVSILHDAIQFDLNANTSKNKMFTKAENGLKIISIAQDSKDGEANTDIVNPITISQIRQAAQSEGLSTLAEEFKDADIIYMDADTFMFLQLQKQNLTNASKEYASTLWNSIFENSKVIHDEVDTAFFRNRAQEGLGARPLDAMERDSALKVDEFFNIYINTIVLNGWTESDLEYLFKNKKVPEPATDDDEKPIKTNVKDKDGKTLKHGVLLSKLKEAPSFTSDSGEAEEGRDRQTYVTEHRKLLIYKFEDLGKVKYKDWHGKYQERSDYASTFWTEAVQNAFLQYANSILAGKELSKDEFLDSPNKQAENLRASFIGRASVLRQRLGQHVDYDPVSGLMKPCIDGVLAPQLQLSDPYFAAHTEYVYKRTNFDADAKGKARFEGEDISHDPKPDDLEISNLSTVTSMASAIQDAIESGADFCGFTATIDAVEDLAKLEHNIGIMDLRDEKLKPSMRDIASNMTTIKQVRDFEAANTDILDLSEEISADGSRVREHIFYLDGRMMDDVSSNSLISKIVRESGKVILAKLRGQGWILTYYDSANDREIRVTIDLENDYKLKKDSDKTFEFGVASYLTYLSGVSKGDSDAREKMSKALQSETALIDGVKGTLDAAQANDCIERSLESGVLFYLNAPATRATDIQLTEKMTSDLKKEIEAIKDGDGASVTLAQSKIEVFGVIDGRTTSWFFMQLIGRDRGIKYYEDGASRFAYEGLKPVGERIKHNTHLYVINTDPDATDDDGNFKQALETSEEKADFLESWFVEADKISKTNALFNTLSDLIDITGAQFLSRLQYKESAEGQVILQEWRKMYQSFVGLNSDMRSQMSDRGKSSIEALQARIDGFLQFLIEVKFGDIDTFNMLSDHTRAHIDAEIEIFQREGMSLNMKKSQSDLRSAEYRDKRAGIARATRISELVGLIQEHVATDMLPKIAPLAGASQYKLISTKTRSVEADLAKGGYNGASLRSRMIQEGMIDAQTGEYTRRGALLARYLGKYKASSGIVSILMMILRNSGIFRGFRGGDDDPFEIVVALMNNGYLSSVNDNFGVFENKLKMVGSLVERGMLSRSIFADESLQFAKKLRYRTSVVDYIHALQQYTTERFTRGKAFKQKLNQSRHAYQLKLQEFRKYYDIEPWLTFPQRIPLLTPLKFFKFGRRWSKIYDPAIPVPLTLLMLISDNLGHVVASGFYPIFYGLGYALTEVSQALGTLKNDTLRLWAGFWTNMAQRGIAKEVDKMEVADESVAKFAISSMRPNVNFEAISNMVDEGIALRKFTEEKKDSIFSFIFFRDWRYRRIFKLSAENKKAKKILRLIMLDPGKKKKEEAGSTFSKSPLFDSEEALMDAIKLDEIKLSEEDAAKIIPYLSMDKVSEQQEEERLLLKAANEHEGAWAKFGMKAMIKLKTLRPQLRGTTNAEKLGKLVLPIFVTVGISAGLLSGLIPGHLIGLMIFKKALPYLIISAYFTGAGKFIENKLSNVLNSRAKLIDLIIKIMRVMMKLHGNPDPRFRPVFDAMAKKIHEADKILASTGQTDPKQMTGDLDILNEAYQLMRDYLEDRQKALSESDDIRKIQQEQSDYADRVYELQRADSEGNEERAASLRSVLKIFEKRIRDQRRDELQEVIKEAGDMPDDDSEDASPKKKIVEAAQGELQKLDKMRCEDILNNMFRDILNNVRVKGTKIEVTRMRFVVQWLRATGQQASEKLKKALVELDQTVDLESGDRGSTANIHKKIVDLSKEHDLVEDEVSILYKYAGLVDIDLMGIEIELDNNTKHWRVVAKGVVAEVGKDGEATRRLPPTRKARNLAATMQRSLDLIDERIAESESVGAAKSVTKLKQMKEMMISSTPKGAFILSFEKLGAGENAARNSGYVRTSKDGREHRSSELDKEEDGGDLTDARSLISFDRKFLEFVMRIGESHTDAAAWIMLERFGHEMCHTDSAMDNHGDAAEELTNKLFDWALHDILYSNRSMRLEMEQVFAKYGDVKHFSSAHFYLDTLTKIDQGDRVVVSEDEAIIVLAEETIERLLNQRTMQGQSTEGLEELKSATFIKNVMVPLIKERCKNNPVIIREELPKYLRAFVKISPALTELGKRIKEEKDIDIDLTEVVDANDLLDTVEEMNGQNADPLAFARLVKKTLTDIDGIDDYIDTLTTIEESYEEMILGDPIQHAGLEVKGMLSGLRELQKDDEYDGVDWFDGLIEGVEALDKEIAEFREAQEPKASSGGADDILEELRTLKSYIKRATGEVKVGKSDLSKELTPDLRHRALDTNSVIDIMNRFMEKTGKDDNDEAVVLEVVDNVAFAFLMPFADNIGLGDYNNKSSLLRELAKKHFEEGNLNISKTLAERARVMITENEIDPMQLLHMIQYMQSADLETMAKDFKDRMLKDIEKLIIRINERADDETLNSIIIAYKKAQASRDKDEVKEELPEFVAKASLILKRLRLIDEKLIELITPEDVSELFKEGKAAEEGRADQLLFVRFITKLTDSKVGFAELAKINEIVSGAYVEAAPENFSAGMESLQRELMQMQMRPKEGFDMEKMQEAAKVLQEVQEGFAELQSDDTISSADRYAKLQELDQNITEAMNRLFDWKMLSLFSVTSKQVNDIMPKIFEDSSVYQQDSSEDFVKAATIAMALIMPSAVAGGMSDEYFALAGIHYAQSNYELAIALHKKAEPGKMDDLNIFRDAKSEEEAMQQIKAKLSQQGIPEEQIGAMMQKHAAQYRLDRDITQMRDGKPLLDSILEEDIDHKHVSDLLSVMSRFVKTPGEKTSSAGDLLAALKADESLMTDQVKGIMKSLLKHVIAISDDKSLLTKRLDSFEAEFVRLHFMNSELDGETQTANIFDIDVLDEATAELLSASPDDTRRKRIARYIKKKVVFMVNKNQDRRDQARVDMANLWAQITETTLEVDDAQALALLSEKMEKGEVKKYDDIDKICREAYGEDAPLAEKIALLGKVAGVSTTPVALLWDSDNKLQIQGVDDNVRSTMSEQEKDLYDVVLHGIEFMNSFRVMLVKEDPKDEKGLVKKFDIIVAGMIAGSANGVSVRGVQATLGGAIAEREASIRVTHNIDGEAHSLSTLALPEGFVQFMKAAIAADKSGDKLSSGMLIFHQLAHEAGHDDEKIQELGIDILASEIGDEIAMRVIMDGLIENITYAQPNLKKEIDKLINAHQGSAPKYVSGHYSYRKNSFGIESDDPKVEPKLKENEQIVEDTTRRVISQLLDEGKGRKMDQVYIRVLEKLNAESVDQIVEDALDYFGNTEYEYDVTEARTVLTEIIQRYIDQVRPEVEAKIAEEKAQAQEAARVEAAAKEAYEGSREGHMISSLRNDLLSLREVAAHLQEFGDASGEASEYWVSEVQTTYEEFEKMAGQASEEPLHERFGTTIKQIDALKRDIEKAIKTGDDDSVELPYVLTEPFALHSTYPYIESLINNTIDALSYDSSDLDQCIMVAETVLNTVESNAGDAQKAFFFMYIASSKFMHFDFDVTIKLIPEVLKLLEKGGGQQDEKMIERIESEKSRAAHINALAKNVNKYLLDPKNSDAAAKVVQIREAMNQDLDEYMIDFIKMAISQLASGNEQALNMLWNMVRGDEDVAQPTDAQELDQQEIDKETSAEIEEEPEADAAAEPVVPELTPEEEAAKTVEEERLAVLIAEDIVKKGIHMDDLASGLEIDLSRSGGSIDTRLTGKNDFSMITVSDTIDNPNMLDRVAIAELALGMVDQVKDRLEREQDEALPVEKKRLIEVIVDTLISLGKIDRDLLYSDLEIDSSASAKGHVSINIEGQMRQIPIVSESIYDQKKLHMFGTKEEVIDRVRRKVIAQAEAGDAPGSKTSSAGQEGAVSYTTTEGAPSLRALREVVPFGIVAEAFGVGVVKPAMHLYPALEPATLRERVAIFNSASDVGIRLEVEPGEQVLAFEATTVTEELARTLSEFLDTFVTIRENVRIVVYGDADSRARGILEKEGIDVSMLVGLPERITKATIVHREGTPKLNLDAKKNVEVIIENVSDFANTVIAPSDILFAIFNYSFEQFVRTQSAQLRRLGIDINPSSADFNALFPNSGSDTGGAIRVRPVDKKKLDDEMRTRGQIAVNA